MPVDSPVAVNPCYFVFFCAIIQMGPILRITSFYWTRERIEHIARHRVRPEEVEEAAFDDPYRVVQRLKKAEALPGRMIYRLLGQTQTGRYLTIIFLPLGHGRACVVTAREMTRAERRYYLARKNQTAGKR